MKRPRYSSREGRQAPQKWWSNWIRALKEPHSTEESLQTEDAPAAPDDSSGNVGARAGADLNDQTMETMFEDVDQSALDVTSLGHYQKRFPKLESDSLTCWCASLTAKTNSSCNSGSLLVSDKSSLSVTVLHPMRSSAVTTSALTSRP